MDQIDNAMWYAVPGQVILLAKAAMAAYEYANASLPSEINAFYEPLSGTLLIHGDTSEKCASEAPFSIVYSNELPVPNRPWMFIKKAFPSLAQLTGWEKSVVPGTPTGLSATIGTGLLGAGLGYGAGTLAEQFLPERYFQKGKLRRTAAMLGGAAGVGLPIWASARGWFDEPSVKKEPDPVPSTDAEITQAGNPAAEEHKIAVASALDILKQEGYSLHPWYIKYADDYAFNQSGSMSPIGKIDVDDFNNVVWRDPYTSPHLAAAVTGVTSGASALRGGSDTISVGDIANVAVGMGVGYGAGLVGGKILGALAGLKPEAQKSLQAGGMWAGLISTAVPILFGGKTNG